jgi:hypothetical protein
MCELVHTSLSCPKKWFMQARDTHHAGSRNWFSEKGPAFVGGAKEIVMQRGRLGGIPLPRTFPIQDSRIGSMMVVRLRLFLGRAGTVWRCPALLLGEGAPDTLSPPSGHPREQKLKIKGESAPGPCFP